MPDPPAAFQPTPANPATSGVPTPATPPIPAGPALAPTPQTTLRRHPERGSYDRAVVHAVLDEALICHVGFVAEGRPYVIPTIHARQGELLYLHGSPASRMLRSLKAGIDVCVTVTLLDALVLARSAFNHSLNYRSVVVLGRAREVTEVEERSAALTAIVDHIAAGRSGEARPPSEVELRSTLVLSVPLDEVSAKVRTGPPGDDEDDLALPVWAGLLPLRTVTDPPIDDPRLAALAPRPVPSPVVTAWRRPG